MPKRYRKLLPRFITVEPAEKLELITVGVGLGVGVGVGVGVGDWARACDPAATTTSKAIARVRTRWRPAPVLFARQGDEQRMKFNPDKERQP